MKVYAHYRDFPVAEWRWPDFSPQEMACRGDNTLAIDEDAMDKLQTLRVRLGRPLIINSAYRSPSHNKNVGGAKGSMHLQAKAFDVSMSNHDPAIFEAAARAVGFTGFGFYKNSGFIHIDTGPSRTWNSRWYAPSTVSSYDVARETHLAVEPPRQPETAAQDKAVVGSVIGGGGALVGGGALLSSLGALTPTAQIIAITGIMIALIASGYVFRNRLRKLA